jgi:hypothetical protein
LYQRPPPLRLPRFQAFLFVWGTWQLPWDDNEAAAAGLELGPLFKQILDTLYDAQLNDQLTEREQALERMQELIMAI